MYLQTSIMGVWIALSLCINQSWKLHWNIMPTFSVHVSYGLADAKQFEFQVAIYDIIQNNLMTCEAVWVHL